MRLPLPARDLVILLVAGGGLRLAMLVTAGADAPLGPDLPYWGYAAAEWLHGVGPATHPPLLPMLAGAGERLFGTGLLWPQWLVTLVAGALLAPATALVLAELDGPATGRLAGVLTLGLPAVLLASMEVEPVAPALLWLLAMLWLSTRVARDADLRAATALGAAGALSAATKEGGWVDLAVIALPAVVLARERRASLLAGLCLGGAVAGVALAALVGQAGGAGVASKSALPFDDVRRWLVEGVVPPPLLQSGDPVGLPAGFDPPRFAEASTAERLGLALGVQAWRLALFLGPWALLIPGGLVGVGRLWRRGQLPAAVAGPVLLRGLAVLGGLVVVIQGRHAEWLAMGGLWAAAMTLSRLPRAAGVLASLAVLAWTARSVPGNIDHVGSLAVQARAEAALADWVRAVVPAEATIVSPLHVVGARTGRLTHVDQWVGKAPEGEAWVVARAGEHPTEASETAPPTLQPLCVRRELSTLAGSFELAETRVEDCQGDPYKDTVDEDGALHLALEPGSRGARPTSRRRARPGRTHHAIESVEDDRSAR